METLRAQKATRGYGPLLLVQLLALGACAPSNDEPAQAAAAVALDSSSKPVQSCDIDQMQRIATDQKYLSWNEESDICQVVVNRLGTGATEAVLRTMFVGVSAFKLKGDKDDAHETAYELMNLVEARQVESAGRIKDTLNVAFKLYEMTDGHVTPKDLNVLLRSAGPDAKLSDDGLVGMGAVL
jgi:hypothetical protein